MKIRTLLTSTLIVAVAVHFAALKSNAANIPPYIDTTANHISMNGGDWNHIRQAIDDAGQKSATDKVVRILHIGDSHIQAEFVTNHLRKLLQERYGNAGRGLICPLRLAGTNQPVDYKITSTGGGEWTQTRLLKYPWPVEPGLTGIAARPSEATTVVFHPMGDGHEVLNATFLTSDGVKNVSYPVAQDSVTFAVRAGQSVYGAILDNGRPGLLYSAIGNNGACYTDYSLIKGFAARTRVFAPDLIVLSMGTNEGFSTMSDAQIERSVRDLVTTLRDYNPQASMLILLPMECQKNRNHGHKPLSPYYDINTRVAQAKDIIARTAADMHVPVWDFYTVAGGRGASDRWLADGLMNKDRIHLVRPGYELMAELLYRAIIERLD